MYHATHWYINYKRNKSQSVNVNSHENVSQVQPIMRKIEDRLQESLPEEPQTNNWSLYQYCDANYAGDKVTPYTHIRMGVIRERKSISWTSSRLQNYTLNPAWNPRFMHC